MATIPELRKMISERKLGRLEQQPETQEEGLLDKIVDSVPKNIMFAPSLMKETLRLPRQFEAIEDMALRAVTGLPIQEELIQEIRKPLETSPLDFISTQGRIRETMEILLPEIKMPTEAEHVLAPGRTIVLAELDMFREGFKEVADLVGFALRPDQMFGMLPLFTGALRLTGASIRKLTQIIKGVEKQTKLFPNKATKFVPTDEPFNIVTEKQLSDVPYKFKSLGDDTTDRLFYHGTKANIVKLTEADPLQFGRRDALFGEGLYLTDSAEIARGYAKSGRVIEQGKEVVVPRRVFNGKLNKNINLFDLEKPLTPDVAKIFEKETGVSVKGKTGVQAWDILIEEIEAEGMTVTEAGEIFSGIQRELEKLGFDGFKHIGGRLTAVGKKHGEHNVVILWDTGSEKGIADKISHVGVQPAGLTITSVDSAKRKIAQQLAKETGVKADELNKYIDDFHNFDGGKGTGIAYESEGAKNVAAMFDRAEALSAKQKAFSPKRLFQTLKRRIVDVAGNVKSALLKEGEAGRAVVMNHDLIAGAHTKAIIEYNNVANKVYGKLSRNEIRQLNRVIQSRRTIQINKFKDIKHPERLQADDHARFINEMPKELGQKIQERANLYFGEMKNQLTKLHDEGLVTDEVFEKLLSQGDYSPRRFLKFVDPDRQGFSIQGGKITVPDSGLKRLEEGSFGLMETDSSLLLSQVIGRAQARILRNRANQALHRLAEINPDNGIVFLKDPKIPNKSFEPVSVMIGGQPKQMWMPSEFAREWLIRDPEINSVLAETLGWLSGSKILKPMATGLNPGFAFTNIFRDMAHAWLTTKEFSSFLPKAIGQIGRNTASVWNDAIFRKGAYLDYMNEGGGMEFMTHQGRIVNPMKGVFGKLQTYMGYVGETSEILGRLMLRQQAIRNGKSVQEATWIARNYLDFSQGGSAIKAVDSAVPYLSAGIQGTRGIIRAGIQDPAVFTYKVAQIGTLATGLYLANKHTNPEGWAQVSDRDKVNNWIIMTTWAFTDKNGDKSYIYFKFAKDQGQRLFATAFENGMAKYMGEELNWTQVAESIKSFMPASITALPPTISAMLGYLANKDFWLLKDVWKGHEDIEAGEEYHVNTPSSFVTLGKVTGLSPERTRFALAQLFTRGNIWTSLVGHGWKQLFDTMPESFREDTTNELILKQPIIKRMVNFTRPFTEFREPFKEIRKEVATEEFVQNREFNRLSKGVISGKIEKKELNGFLRKQPREDKFRLRERFQQNKVLDKIPNKRLWIEILKTKDPVARAREFFLVFDKSSEKKQRELEKSSRRILGVRTVRFVKELNRLKKENKK